MEEPGRVEQRVAARERLQIALAALQQVNGILGSRSSPENSPLRAVLLVAERWMLVADQYLQGAVTAIPARHPAGVPTLAVEPAVAQAVTDVLRFWGLELAQGRFLANSEGRALLVLLNQRAARVAAAAGNPAQAAAFYRAKPLLLRAALTAPGVAWWIAAYRYGVSGLIAIFIETEQSGQIMAYVRGDEPELRDLLATPPPAHGRQWDGVPKHDQALALAVSWLLAHG